MEGTGFRDRAPEFEALGVAIVGASFDTPEENKAFATSHGFPFPLLCDPDRVAGAAYETLRHPDEVMPEWAKRRTFVIDPEGVIRKVYKVADAMAHPGEVLDDLRELMGNST